jgi:hypothetical protein
MARVEGKGTLYHLVPQMRHREGIDCLRVFVLLLLIPLLSCSGPEANVPASNPAAQLQNIPSAIREKYEKVKQKDWQNPYLIVRTDGIGLVDLANNEIHILKPNDVAAALADLPSTAWPLGRVVAIEQKAGTSDQEKTSLRTTRALLAGTLQDLRVDVFWITPR